MNEPDHNVVKHIQSIQDIRGAGEAVSLSIYPDALQQMFLVVVKYVRGCKRGQPNHCGKHFDTH